MKIGFYSGSFDPFTNGHLHIIKTASKVFDKVIVGIGINYQKKRRDFQFKSRTSLCSPHILSSPQLLIQIFTISKKTSLSSQTTLKYTPN